jgi:hypothetical protein
VLTSFHPRSVIVISARNGAAGDILSSSGLGLTHLAWPSHLQAVLGGNSSPSKDDITSILGSGERAFGGLRAGWYELSSAGVCALGAAAVGRAVNML